MALAETAELAVRLSLDDTRFKRTLSGVDSRLSRLGDTAKRVGKGIAIGLGVAATAGAVILLKSLKDGLEALKEDAIVAAQTEAVIKSTGAAAGLSASQVGDLAAKLSRLNAVQDDVVQNTANLLLTFTNIGAKDGIFEQTTQAVLDMSAALGQDAKSSAIQLGKALNDPLTGLTALRRVGVAFSEDQVKEIQRLTKSNQLRAAQKIILKEIQREFGGVAEAQAKADPGRGLAISIENLQKALAKNLLPVVQKIQERLTDFFNKPETMAAVQRIGDSIAALFTDENLKFAGEAIETAAKAVGTAIDLFNQLPGPIKALAIGAFAVNKVTGGAVGGIATALGKTLGAGLKQIFAANVTVIGKTVTAPGLAGKGAAPGVAGAGTAGAGAAGGLLAPGAAPLIVGASLPFAMFYGIPAITKAVFGAGQGSEQAPIKGATLSNFQTGFLSSLGTLGTRIERNTEAVQANTDVTDFRSDRTKPADVTDFRSDRDTGPGVALAAPVVAQLKRLGSLQDRLASAKESGDRGRAQRLQAKIDTLRTQIAKGDGTLANKQDRANSALGRIANKKTRFTANTHVTVSTAVSVRDQGLAARAHVNVARRTGLWVE